MVDQLELTPRMAAVVRMFLAEPTKPQYGFDLMEKLKISSGTLYPILTKMAKAGWIVGQLEDIDPAVEERPPRRNYLLTGEGEIAAVKALARMAAMYQAPSMQRPGFAGGST